MIEITISEFKTKCSALLERVRTTGQHIRVTRFGKPIADVVPTGLVMDRASWIGSMKDSMEMHF